MESEEDFDSYWALGSGSSDGKGLVIARETTTPIGDWQKKRENKNEKNKKINKIWCALFLAFHHFIFLPFFLYLITNFHPQLPKFQPLY